MLKLNFKIAFRNFQRNLINSIISIGGMAVAISAFLIIILYVKYEREYDALTPNYSQIYLVGRDLKGVQSSLISAQFAQKIKETFPEIDRVGKVRYTDFEFPISNKKSRIYVKNVVSADYDAYKILDFQLDEHAFNSTAKSERTFFLSEADLNTLFPDKKDTSPELVTIGPVAAGQKGKVQGSFKPQKHTNIVFDGLAVTADIASGMDATDNAYMTFIQVKPEADVANLTLKFNRLYASDAISRDETVNPESTAHVVTLKPLRDLHLQSGSGNSAKVVNVLLWLGILVLVLACIGFVNMNIVKSTARAKEVGVKQVLGVTRVGLMMQFIIEILIQSALSAVLGLLLTEFLLPVVNTVFEVNLSIWSSSGSLFLLLILVVVFATLLASLYPSLVLSSYKPASILKGSFSKGKQVLWLQKSLLAFQFSIAVVFIVGLLIVNRQLSFMQTEDKGFSPNHVVYIRNMAIFDKPDVFKAVKEKILSMDGVRAVSVANQIPTGPKAPAQLFTINGSEGYLNAVAVDIDYFKTLDIKLAEGRFYNPNFSSDESESILINEAAVKKYSIASPLGKLIKNCNHTYQIVGVIKDFKSDGFETAVLPTAYTLSNRCGPPKTSIIIKISDGRVAGVLKSLRAEWPKINKLDGEDFRYDFMDTLYGQLFKKQEQLKFVFSCLSVVTILIALFGLYAYAKLMIEARFKEIAIRKILGAENFELLSILNSSFLWLVLISNVVAAPLVYIAANRWLQGFAYKQDISLSPFLIAALVTVGLTIETVCIQAFKILKAQPVKALKYE